MGALPKQVQAQIDKANQLVDTLYKDGKLVLPPDGSAPAPDAKAPATAPVSPDPAATPPVAAAPAAAPPEPTPLPQEGFEQKYKVLQGKYNAEVPRLQKMVHDLTTSVTQLRENLTSTQTLLAAFGSQQAPAAAGASPGSAPAAPVKLVKDAEVTEFGADLIDVARRIAREEIAAQVPSVIDQRMAPVTQRVDQVASAASNVAQRVSQTDRQTVHDMLSKEVPNWVKINSNSEFLAWLDQEDPFSGHVRGDLLAQAYKSNDGPRVVRFFKGFLSEHAALTPPAPAAAAPAPAPAPAPQVSLETLVTPGLPKTGAGTPDGSGKRVWTRAEIGKFYADKTAGKYNSTDGKARAAATEADIFAAQRENRVKP